MYMGLELMGTGEDNWMSCSPSCQIQIPNVRVDLG